MEFSLRRPPGNPAEGGCEAERSGEVAANRHSIRPHMAAPWKKQSVARQFVAQFKEISPGPPVR